MTYVKATKSRRCRPNRTIEHKRRRRSERKKKEKETSGEEEGDGRGSFKGERMRNSRPHLIPPKYRPTANTKTRRLDMGIYSHVHIYGNSASCAGVSSPCNAMIG